MKDMNAVAFMNIVIAEPTILANFLIEENT